MSGLTTAKLGTTTQTLPCRILQPLTGEVPGLLQQNPPDRTDGAVLVILAGVVADRPNWDGIVLLPGQRTVWVHVSAGEVISFASFVTLRMADMFGAKGQEGFENGVTETLSRPERLANALAQADVTPGYAWGALIGAELAATRP